jgi:hypothetical protein
MCVAASALVHTVCNNTGNRAAVLQCLCHVLALCSGWLLKLLEASWRAVRVEVFSCSMPNTSSLAAPPTVPQNVADCKHGLVTGCVRAACRTTRRPQYSLYPAHSMPQLAIVAWNTPREQKRESKPLCSNAIICFRPSGGRCQRSYSNATAVPLLPGIKNTGTVVDSASVGTPASTGAQRQTLSLPWH